MTTLDPDRVLALAYVPVSRRPAVEALWILDAALGAAIAGGSEPMITRIKLAWWREALERLDQAPPPAEPVLQALAAHVLPMGLTGLAMAEMEASWSVLLKDTALSADDLELYADRGRLLFRYSAMLLGGTDPVLELGGADWALADLARHSGEPDAAAALARVSQGQNGERWPKRLRPLGMLAMLARRDAREGPGQQGSPRRMVRMLGHRLSGW